MSTNTQPMDLPQVSSAAMIRTLGGVAMLSGFLVVLVYQITQPFILENQRHAIERAVFQVVPGATERRDFLIDADGAHPADQGGKGTPIYAAYDATGKLRGVAAAAAAQGYQDVIRILYGYSPDCACITGISVLRMAETPGLGDKIAKDPAFLANFAALDTRLNAGGDALAHPVVTVKHGTKTEPWQIDAISGATISSTAVGRMLNSSAQRLVPLITAHLDQLRRH